MSVELSIVIDKTLQPKVRVHNKELPNDHPVFKANPSMLESVADIKRFLETLAKYRTCVGNPDPQWQDFIRVGGDIVSATSTVSAYREQNFHAVVNGFCYASYIRTAKCCLLVENNGRCKECCTYRGTLRKMESREKKKESPPIVDYASSLKPHRTSSPAEVGNKLRQLQDENHILWDKVDYLTPWLVDRETGMKCTVCSEHEEALRKQGVVQSRVFLEGCTSYKAESIAFHENSSCHKSA